MRNVTFVANGKEFKTYAEARNESKYVDTVLSENYRVGYERGHCEAVTFGSYTGKLADGWKAPYQRI